MKIHSLRLMVAVVFLLFAGQSMGATLDIYGGLDALVDSTRLTKSSDLTEEQWVEGSLGGTDVLFGEKIEDASMAWEGVDGSSSQYALNLGDGSDSDYFLVKTGGGKKYKGPTHFLFDNIGDLAWAVIDLESMGIDTSRFDITRVSHVSTLGDPSAVPLPAAVWLFASGLAGLFFFGRKKNAV